MRALFVTVCALCLAWSASARAQLPAETCRDGRAAMDAGDSALAAGLLEECLATSQLEPEAEVQTYAALGAAYLAEDAFEDALSAYNMASPTPNTRRSPIRPCGAIAALPAPNSASSRLPSPTCNTQRAKCLTMC